MRNSFFCKLLTAVLLVFTLAAHAQDYPSKPIKIIVPFPAGDGSDRVARIIAEKLRTKWGQTITVENRTGAGGNIGAEVVAKAPPDGYTLMFTPQFALVVNKSLYPKLNYDPDAFVPVSISVAGDIVLLVNPKVPVSSVQQLIEFAKANPGRLSYASPSIGSLGHLMAELFKSKTETKLVHVPYRGSNAALTDLLGGQVDMMFVALGSALQYIQSGTVRALAISSAKRNPNLPEVPLVSDVLPDFVHTYWFGMVAPPGTPPAIANRLSAAVAEVMKEQDVISRLTGMNLEPVGSTPTEMAQVMKRERERWGNVVRATGATVD